MAGPLKVTRDLADKVRKIGLTEIIDVLENKRDYGMDFRKQLLLKLAPTLLPRINEHSGPDGKPIPILGYVPKDDSDIKDTEPEEKD